MTVSDDLIEDIAEDGSCILRRAARNTLLEMYYHSYNHHYFGQSLPFVPVFWAQSIVMPDGNQANAIYVPGDAKLKKQYIAIDERLIGMFPLDRLCLLHEMIHVKLGPDANHGQDFISEFKRVLDANHWEVMGC